MSLLEFTQNGIYCPRADVYIDPWRKVERAVVTHGHSDHARWGMGAYLSTPEAMPVIKHRLGSKISIQTMPFGETKTINGVKFSFHPAGHILGSAQVRVEYKGEVWVASGDYKTEDDGFCRPFEPVKCDVFITESTFGLPVYKWRPQKEIFADIHAWWRKNQDEGKTTVLTGYSLGKAQRIIANLDPSIGTIFTHGAIENTNAVIREQGVNLQETELITAQTDKKRFPGSIVIAPPSAVGTPWMKKLGKVSVGIASGWMMLRGTRRRRSVDRGFVLSDHADWMGLNEAIEGTGAQKVYVTHGYTEIFANWLQSKGIEGIPMETRFSGELAEISESGEEENEGKEAAE